MKCVKERIRRRIGQLYFFLKNQSTRAKCERLVERGLLRIGRHTYGSPIVDVYAGSEALVIIGNFCSISPGVRLITGGIHPLNWISTFPFRNKWKLKGANKDGMPTTKGDIIIGSDVWVGTDVMILSGVTIGHGAVIAARSVVTRDIPPYAIVAGVPARVIRYRFSERIIKKLLELKWWEWNDCQIKENISLLSSSNVEEFLNKFFSNS